MNLKEYIRDIPNFPIEGVNFKDISPLLSSPKAFDYTCKKIAAHLTGVDKIVALDARGFIFGGVVANILGIAFVPVRKKGKLPSETISVEYELEYGSNTFEIHKDAINPGENIAIIDDLLATGGSALAASQLVEQLGGKIDSMNFVINIGFLGGTEILSKYTVNSLIEY